MLSRLPLQNQPAEDKAITNLLEIDQREQEVNIWEDRRELFKARTTGRTVSSRRFRPTNSHRYTNPHHTKPEDLRNSQKPNNPENDSQITNPCPNSDPKNSKFNKQEDFNEGEYWSSRVNWMSEHKNQPFSQPRLNKKFSFGYEVNGRKGSRNGYRGERDERARQDEYKTNLIYSLLHQDESLIQHKYWENDGMRSTFCGNRSKVYETGTNIFKKGSVKAKHAGLNETKQSEAAKLSPAVQSSMRQTLKKLYLRNHNEERAEHNSQSKQSEQERSTLVRQLLINLENLKEVSHETKDLPVEGRQGSHARESHVQEVHVREEPLAGGGCGKGEKKSSNIVNLNLEAEKTHKGRAVNRCQVKRPLPLVVAN